ncbi:MAG: FixH family protein [Burkholderiaceae bacterium]
MSNREFALLASLVACVALMVIGPRAATAATAIQRFESGGIAVDLSVLPADPAQGELRAGEQATVRLRVTETQTGQPMINLHPRAWMQARRSADTPSEVECREKVSNFVAGALPQRADVDLNAFIVVTLNDDRTLTFINPQVALTVSKLESIVVLPGLGADWALSPSKNFIYVTMPVESAVAVVDVRTRKLVKTIPTGARSAPTRVAVQPDGRQIWVGLDGSDEVIVIDAVTLSQARHVRVAAGLHTLAFSTDSRHAFVSNTVSGSVSIVDTRSLDVLETLPVGDTPVAMAYGAAAQVLYVTVLNGSQVSVIDSVQRRVITAVPVRRGSGAIQFEPDGRHALVLNRLDSTLTVIDSADHHSVTTVDVVKEPDQLRFTERYVYVRGLGSEKFSLLELAALRAGSPQVVDIQAGRLAPSSHPAHIGVADMIAPMPDGNAALIANAGEQMLYLYQEGMMAQTRTLQNYRRVPRGLMVIDHSLRETAPGVYTTTVTLSRSGTLDVPVLFNTPRLLNCFEVMVAPGARELTVPRPSLLVEAVPAIGRVHARTPTSIRVRLLDTESRQPVTGLVYVQVLVFAPPGAWQQRRRAVETEPGVYQIDERFPRAGLYQLIVSSSARSLRFTDSSAIAVIVDAEPSSHND